MKLLLSLPTYTIVFIACFIVQAAESPNGFIVWAEGSGCDRELKFNRLKNGKLGPKQTAVKKGIGADMWVEISFDGKWIAFSRAIERFKWRYGECDYMAYEKFDIYIARIDGTLSAKPIKIGHGYWPSWGDDSYKTAKTLYFNVFEKRAIYKTIIKPNGSFSTPVQHTEWPKFTYGTNRNRYTIEISPNGRYIAYKPIKFNIWDIKEKKDLGVNFSGSYFPSWGPRSKYVISRSNCVYKVDNGQGIQLENSGLLGYWPGISNDAEYDNGKLWIIGMISSTCCRNIAGPVGFKEVDISGGQWNVGDSTKVGLGTSADIHIFGKVTQTIAPSDNLISDNGIFFTTRIKNRSSGLQLIIISKNLSGYSSGLYDLQGKRHQLISLSTSSKNFISLQGISDGRYVLKIESGKKSIQKAILITR